MLRSLYDAILHLIKSRPTAEQQTANRISFYKISCVYKHSRRAFNYRTNIEGRHWRPSRADITDNDVILTFVNEKQ